MSPFATLSLVFCLLHLAVVHAEVRSNSRCQDISLECEYRQKYCYNSAYTGLMFKICRSTCDWCQKSLEDVMHTNRRLFAAPAQIPEWVTPNHAEDVEGSGTTGNTDNCVDLSMSCSTTSALCTSSSYQKIMLAKCPKTCGYC